MAVGVPHRTVVRRFIMVEGAHPLLLGVGVVGVLDETVVGVMKFHLFPLLGVQMTCLQYNAKPSKRWPDSGESWRGSERRGTGSLETAGLGHYLSGTKRGERELEQELPGRGPDRG